MSDEVGSEINVIEPSVTRADDLERGFTRITLNRPDRLNSLSNDLLGSLATTLEEVAANDSIRSVVVTGAGRAFCAGADTDEMAGGTGDGIRG